MNDPLVSVIIPCYKGEAYLAEAIESCLRQSHARIEIIAVDDASPDRCAEIAEAFAGRDPRVRVVRRPVNGGVAAAFNSGFESARGDYLTRLAQDDWFEPSAIAEMTRYLEDHPEAALVYADEIRINEQTGERRNIVRPPPATALDGGNHIGLCVMWQRALWEKVGQFDSRFDTAEDYDYWERAARHFRFGHLEGQPLLSMRFHARMGSKTFSGKQEMLAAEILARYSAGSAAGRKQVACAYLDAAYNYGSGGDAVMVLKCWLRALACRPFDLAVYAKLAGTMRHLLASLILNKRESH